MLNAILDKRFGPLSPLEQIVEQKQEQEKEYVGMENTAAVASSSSAVMSQARLYRASSANLRRLRTRRQSTGNPGAGIRAFQPFFDSAPPLASLPGYIRWAEDMEPIGQG